MCATKPTEVESTPQQKEK